MSNLEQVLSELLEADARAKDTVDASAAEADAILQAARQEFELQSAQKLKAAKEQAESLMKSALDEAETEAARIDAEAQKKRDLLAADFEKRMPAAVAKLASEIAEECKRKAER